MVVEEREYELVLLGATGYTGKFCAEHITTHLPTDLRWAVAGRNSAKLSAVVDQIEPLNSDRRQPAIEIVSLNSKDLHALAKKSKLIITTVGPYHLYGTPVVEACASNGTHYVDATGESPWVFDIVKKYHVTAKETNAIIIPQTGIESATSDMVTFSLISLFRHMSNVGAREVVASAHSLDSLPSGGTLATAIGIFDKYSLAQIADSVKPWALSPIPGPRSNPNPWQAKFLGIRTVPELGVLTTGLTAITNTMIVQRSWYLLDHGNYYGQNFSYKEYATVKNRVIGILVHFTIALVTLALTLPFVRWLARKLVYQPGTGPARESTHNDRTEWRAVGVADSSQLRKGFAKLAFHGSGYKLTGIFLAEAAIVILRDRCTAHDLGGGVLTTATLGRPYIERLQNAGVEIEAYLLY